VEEAELVEDLAVITNSPFFIPCLYSFHASLLSSFLFTSFAMSFGSRILEVMFAASIFGSTFYLGGLLASFSVSNAVAYEDDSFLSGRLIMACMNFLGDI
jgi:hypothetical protein